MPANSILIADDDEKLLSVLLSYFKDEQFTVHLARDGAEALKRLKEDHPDIMVLDIMMPGIDGFEVCRRARQFTDIPIISFLPRTMKPTGSLGSIWGLMIMW